MKKTQKGFTLIELMIVVAIIGILAAIAIPKFAQMMEKSREGATKGNVGALKSAISIYMGDWQGVTPNDLTGWFSTGGQVAYMDGIPDVKVTGKNPRSAATTYSPVGKNITMISGNNGTNITASGNGWAYESLSGNIWVNNSQVDSFGFSYTTYGY
jgi:prepilin-type N-terminal cleavage/methylation domain-containing protein